jgi:hypothetical protein
MSKIILKVFSALLTLTLANSSFATVIVTSTKQAGGFTVSSADLLQTNLASASGVNSGGFGSDIVTTHPNLYDGDFSTVANVSVSPGSVTFVLDISTNTAGYDITQIDSYFNSTTIANGRANQGFQINLGFVGGGSATLLSKQTWEPNNPVENNTKVSFVNSGGGALFSDFVNLNGGGNIADTSVTATGVQSITITNFDAARAGGIVKPSEFDIFGTATAVPEPSTFALLAGLFGFSWVMLRRRI